MLTKQFLENFLKSKFNNQNIVFEGEGWGSFAFSVRENIIRFPKTDDIDGYKKEEYILLNAIFRSSSRSGRSLFTAK